MLRKAKVFEIKKKKKVSLSLAQINLYSHSLSLNSSGYNNCYELDKFHFHQRCQFINKSGSWSLFGRHVEGIGSFHSRCEHFLTWVFQVKDLCRCWTKQFCSFLHHQVWLSVCSIATLYFSQLVVFLEYNRAHLIDSLLQHLATSTMMMPKRVVKQRSCCCRLIDER